MPPLSIDDFKKKPASDSSIEDKLNKAKSTIEDEDDEEQESVSTKVESKIDKSEKDSTEAETQEAEVEEKIDIDRSLDSYKDEVKKLREENKKKRLQITEAERLAEERVQKLLESRDKELEDLRKIKEKLEKEEKDKELSSKSLEEKASILELELKEKDKDLKKALAKMEDINKKYEEYLREQEDKRLATEEVLNRRIEAEIAKIPEEQRKFAKALVKGEGSLEAGYRALLEAQQENLFGKKKVEVVHSVPKDNSNNKSDKKIPASKASKMKNALAGILDGQKDTSKRII
jgi:chromosome segregation ATPase